MIAVALAVAPASSSEGAAQSDRVLNAGPYLEPPNLAPPTTEVVAPIPARVVDMRRPADFTEREP